MPYTKPNNTPLYVHRKSNHPPRIIDNIPKSINNRLCEISCDEDSFNKATPLYQKVLNDSGYTHNLQYSQPAPAQSVTSPTKNRHRNTIWYNPPYSKNVQTNIGRTFLNILDKEFPKGHPLHKIFNRNTVKVSYSCMTNLKQNTDGHNKSLLHDKKDAQTKSCNHRKPILYVCLISFLWYHGVERNISKCMGWNQLWRYLGEYWNKLTFTYLICSWSLSWSLVAISSHFNRF